jgi:hypothetical protein
MIIKSPQVPVVLVFSWLQQHKPLIDWTDGPIMRWSLFCHTHCLKSAQPTLGRLLVGSEVAPELCHLSPGGFHFLRTDHMTAGSTLSQVPHRLRYHIAPWKTVGSGDQGYGDLH